MLKVEPIHTPGFMVNNLPINSKDALSLVLLTVPPLVKSKSVLFGAKLANPISVEPVREKVWNIYESDRFEAWHVDDEHMAIQYGPYDTQVCTVGTMRLREQLWDMITANIPELKRGEKFMHEIKDGIYQINDHKVGTYGYYIKLTSSGVSVVGAKPCMTEEGISINSNTDPVFSHYLFHSNVSIGTPSAFETAGFTSETYFGCFDEKAPIYTELGKPSVALKVIA